MSTIPSAAGLRAMADALQRIASDGHPHLCPVRGVHSAAQTALLRRLCQQGYSDGKPSPQLTAAGIAYVTQGGE